MNKNNVNISYFKKVIKPTFSEIRNNIRSRSAKLRYAKKIKEGAHFDLPIAIGLLAAMGVLPSDCLNGHILLGELSYRRFFLFGADNG